MKIHINGNLGYIGPIVVEYLKDSLPGVEVTGFDTAYFSSCLVNPLINPEKAIDKQFYGDIRTPINAEMYEGVNAVIQLAAISNDPMGKEFESVTQDINTEAVYLSALQAKQAGVSHFVFASSCSVYGAGGSDAKSERAALNPLTAYANSKVNAEERLKELADNQFVVTCLRFATACGWSPRLRLDLVLNDFIVGAILNKKISILSDGTPWRPLIHVKDMARSIEWASLRTNENGGNFLIMNTGSDQWNYQVKDLAYAVQDVIGGVDVLINDQALPDKRSYRVDFSLFRSLAVNHQPVYDLCDTISEMSTELTKSNLNDLLLNQNNLIRLKVLTDLRNAGKINEQLYWNHFD